MGPLYDMIIFEQVTIELNYIALTNQLKLILIYS